MTPTLLADSFTVRRFRGYPGLIGVMSQVSQWQPRRLEAVLQVGLTYAPLVIVLDITMPDRIRYAVTQVEHSAATDLAWVCDALNLLEAGWQLQEGMLLSPDASQLSEATLLQLLVAGRQPIPDRPDDAQA